MQTAFSFLFGMHKQYQQNHRQICHSLSAQPPHTTFGGAKVFRMPNQDKHGGVSSICGQHTGSVGDALGLLGGQPGFGNPAAKSGWQFPLSPDLGDLEGYCDSCTCSTTKVLTQKVADGIRSSDGEASHPPNPGCSLAQRASHTH